MGSDRSRSESSCAKTVDHQGRPTYTEERLFTYLQQFERDFARSKAQIIDATEGGVLKRGTTVMTFADAIAIILHRSRSRSQRRIIAA